MIQVNLFTTSNGDHGQYENRLPSTKVALKEFFNISEKNRSKIKFRLYSHKSATSMWDGILNDMNVNRMDAQIVSMEDNHYVSKIEQLKLIDSPYLCKWDDDVFINRYVWDFMIENLSTLDDPTHSVLSPIFTNGIPSVDMFVEDFFNEEEKAYVSKLFIREGIPNEMWGCTYAKLNEKIKQMTTWNHTEYWKAVWDHNQTEGREQFLPWFYSIVKGVHPARFSEEFNKFMVDFTVRNTDKVFAKGNYYLDDTFFTPYFCNNLFLTTTEFYKESQTVFHDNWDEGQLTMLANRTGKVPVYVRNSYGIHMAYGCTHDQKQIENAYCSQFFEKFL